MEERSGRSVRKVARSRKRKASSRFLSKVCDRLAGFENVDVPIPCISWNRVQATEARQDSGCGPRTPSGQSRIPISSIAYQGQVIRDGGGLNTKLVDHPLMISFNTPSTIKLHHACTLNALRQIFVWRADDNPFNPLVLCCLERRGRQGIIGFVLFHRPHHHPERTEGFLQQRKLREQSRVHALSRLIPGPHRIAKRLYDVVGGNTDVGLPGAHHAEQGAKDTPNGSHFLALRCPLPRAAHKSV